MPIMIPACGLVFALAGAGLGVLADLTAWGCLGLAWLAGSLAVAALVAAVLWRAARQDAWTETVPDMTGRDAGAGRRMASGPRILVEN